MASDDPKAEGFASRPSRTPPTLDLKAEEVATASGAPGATAAQGTGTQVPGKDTKPAGVDTKPVEAKPAPSMPVEPKSADPKSSEPKPSSTVSTGPKLSDAKPADIKPSDAKLSDAKLSDAKLSDAKPSDAKPSDAKPTGSKPAEAVASGESAAGANTAARAATPAPARSGNGGAVFAGLIAGIIGGGAVAGGLWYALPQFFPPPAPVVEPPPVVNLAPLQSRIAALETRPAFDPRSIAALSERLERSEASLKSLEATVVALKSAPAPTGTSAPTQAQAPVPAVPPALLKTVDDLKASSEATRDALATARRDIEALRTVETNLHTAVAAATAGAQQAGAQAQAQVQALAQSLTPKVEAVGPRLDALKAQIEEATAAATAFNRAAAGLVVLSTFRDAVVSGRPFAAELAAARTTLGPAAGQLDPFAAAAAAGYAAPSKLAATLAQQGAAAIAAERPAPAPVDSSASLVDRLLASAESLVKVRPVTGPGSVDLEGLIATAVGQLKAGQLDDALITLKKLPDPVQARLAVIREIEARTAAVRVAGTLYQQQLAAISRKVP
ncbi:COG4223 family protein [Xanthobacter autotrophicus]|uniref:COG4223 family protein n=1 Tax=Xanthobacter autotrophicus TaxID=280 RepID=UPI00372892E1